MSTCLTCRNWTSQGVPAWAGELGHALCSLKQTRAITLAHWAACDLWAAVGPADVDKRVVWLQKRGVPVLQPEAIQKVIEVDPTPRVGSSPHLLHAGHSHREDSLVHAVGKGWTVDGGRCTGVDAT